MGGHAAGLNNHREADMGRWVVTGGASGIGAQLVKDLAVAGEDVTVWDIKPPAGGAAYEFVDLSKPGAVEAAASKVTGPLKSFVHCAGISAPTSIADAKVADLLRAAFEVHVVSFVVGVQKLADRLVEGKGSVVAIVSAGMDIVYPATLAYGSTKAALRRTIDQLSVELGGRGIRINGIAPGAVATPMTEASWSDKAYADERRSFIPLGRQAGPDAISNVVRFLASDAAEYITGETIYVDGGVRHGIFNQAARKYAGQA
jgi:NAD(P)-dependent dehydrogenase (short-subunit alcohol dehydrogenase family)